MFSLISSPKVSHVFLTYKDFYVHVYLGLGQKPLLLHIYRDIILNTGYTNYMT